MAYFVPSNTGITIVAAVNSIEEKKYSPVYGEDLDVRFILDELPDFYRNFLSGTEYLFSLWGGASQVITSDLLNLYQVDYAKSLRDIPTFTQRKWTRFDLENDVDFSYDPSFSTSGVSGKFSYSSSSQNLSATFTQRSGGVDRYFKSLNGTLDQESSLIWSFDVEVSSAGSISTALVGYITKSSTDLSKSFLSGLINHGSTLSVCILHTPTSGVATVGRVGSVDLSLDTSYQIKTEYSSSESTAKVIVTQNRYQRVSSSNGLTGAGVDGALTVKVLVDTSVDFQSDNISVEVGDFVVFGGYDHEIVEVAQHSLTVKYDTLPSSATYMSYTVIGKKTVDSISLNILNESSKNVSCDAFGLITGVPFDLRDVFTDLVPAASYSTHTSKSMVCIIDNLNYSDPTFAQTPIRIPKLQNAPVSPTDTKLQNIDYRVENSQISFSLPTEGVWHSEFGLFDEGVVYNNFGANAGIKKETTSDEYLNRIRGLYYSLLRGPTVSSIKTGVLASVGLPIAIDGGEVTSINTAYSGQKGLITIDNARTYLYPLAVGTDLSVGDTVNQFTPLCRGVDVYDYINNPTWFNTFPVIEEVQKYHTFLVNIDLDSLDASIANSEEVFQTVAKHLSDVRPTYKDFVFVGSRSVSDITAIDDSILLDLVLHVEDAITEPYPVYDDKRFFPPDYDWAYDQGITPWEEIPSAVAFFAYENTKAKLWRGSSEQSQFLAEASAELEESTYVFQDSSYNFLGTIGRVVSDTGSGGSTDSSSSMIFTGSGESFLTTIKNTGGTPDRDTVVVISSGSIYGVATVTSVNSDNELQTSYTGSDLKGLSSVDYEVRVAGPTGNPLLDVVGTGEIPATLSIFEDTAGPATFLSDIPNTGGVPDNPTFIAINPNSATPTIRKVASVDSDTQITVQNNWAGTASSQDYVVWTPVTALSVSNGNVATITSSGSTATGSYDSIVSSATGVTETVGVVILLKDASNDPMSLNIDENHALEITSPSSIQGSYRVTGLYADSGTNYIVTDPPIAAEVSTVSYEVRRGKFHFAEAGSILEIDSGTNAGTYSITGTSYVTDEGLSSATISGVFAGSDTAPGLWYTRDYQWVRLAYVASDTKIYFTDRWSGDDKTSASDSGGGTGGALVTYTSEKRPVFLSDIDMRALGVYYDQAEELSPDEDVQLQWTPTVGYGGELLHDSSNHEVFTTDSTNTDEIDHTNTLTSTAPSANDVIILPNGRAREVSSYTAGPPGTITLVGTNSAQDDAGDDFTSAALYLVPAASVAIAGTSFTFTNGSSSVAISGALSGATLSAGNLIQPVLPSGSGDNTTDLPVVEIDTVSASTITLTSNYTGDGIVTTKVVVRDTSSMATDLGSYFDLTGADFHNVEVPGSDQTMSYTIPENTFL